MSKIYNIAAATTQGARRLILATQSRDRDKLCKAVAYTTVLYGVSLPEANIWVYKTFFYHWWVSVEVSVFIAHVQCPRSTTVGLKSSFFDANNFAPIVGF